MRLNSRLAILVLVLFSLSAFARPEVQLLDHRNPTLENTLTEFLNTRIDLDLYREIKVRVYYSSEKAPDHAVVFLQSRVYHRLELARVEFNSSGEATRLIKDYHLQDGDRPQLFWPLSCPDWSVEMLVFAPNNDAFEQSIATEVASYARQRGFKTVFLAKDQATRAQFLNYLSCPNLKGSFYDGDSNPQEVVTYDGVASYQDFQSLHGALRHRVTNIWVACEASLDPMLSVMVHDAGSQKYAAGIDDLLVGPSDKAAACAMKAALDGQAMTAAFQSCVGTYDTSQDKWGFSGLGADYFGL
jgi:hypothetical protein